MPALLDTCAANMTPGFWINSEDSEDEESAEAEGNAAYLGSSCTCRIVMLAM